MKTQSKSLDQESPLVVPFFPGQAVPAASTRWTLLDDVDVERSPRPQTAEETRRRMAFNDCACK